MADLATLSLAVDTSGMTGAKRELQDFGTAAAKTEEAVVSFGRTSKKVTVELANDLDKAQAKAADFQRKINDGLNIKTSFGDRGADIEAYGKAMDDLRAKFSPLFANERDFLALQNDINQAFKVGAITEQERSAAIQRAETTFKRANEAVRGYGQAAKFTENDLKLLGFQVNDIITQVGSGTSVFRALTQQGGQIFQVWQMSGLTAKQAVSSLGETVSSIGTRVLSLLNPARVVFGGITAAVVTAGIALSDYLDKQRAIETSLNGLGAASGATVNDINTIAKSAADAAGMSRAAATEIAIALLNTGKIAKDSLGGVIELTRNFATTFGTDIETATQQLAKAFSDPSRGAEQLTSQLHFLDGATLSYIKSLDAQGKATEAAAVLQEKLRQRLADTDKQLGFFARTNAAWAKTFSDGWKAVEDALGRTFAPNATQELEKLIEARNRMLNGPKNSKTDAALEYLDKLIAKAREAVGAEEAVAAAKRQVAKMNDISVEGNTVTANLQPAIAQYQTLLEQRLKLNEALKNPAMLRDAAATREALAMVTAAVNDYAQAGGAIELARQKSIVSHNLEMEALRATTVEERANIAAKQEYLSLLGTTTTEEERLRLAQEKREEVLAQSSKQMADISRDMRDQADLINAETGAMGQSEAARKRLLDQMKAEQELRRMGIDLLSTEGQEYLKNAQAVTEAEIARTKAIEDRQKAQEKATAATVRESQAMQDYYKSLADAEAARDARYYNTDGHDQTMLSQQQEARIQISGQAGQQFSWSPFTGGRFYTPKDLTKDFENADDYFNRKRGIAPATNDNTATGSSTGSALDPISALVEKLRQQQDAVMNRAYTPSAYTDKNADYFYDGSRIFKSEQDKIYDGLQKQIDGLAELLSQGQTLLNQNAAMPAAFAQALTTALVKAGLTAEQIAQALSGFKSSTTGSAQNGPLKNRMGATPLRVAMG